MRLRKPFFYFILLLSISFLTSCSPPARYADPFYNVNYDDDPLHHLPLIKPIMADGKGTTWRVFEGPWVDIPNSDEEYPYSIEDLEIFAVKNGVIMAYTSYVDIDAPAYIQDNYYHWFVIIPDKKIEEGFHTKKEFNEYIQTLGIRKPEWQKPNDVYEEFTQTGCLDWIPDCNQ